MLTPVRWETATTGAWLQRDTLDAPLDPSNANRYACVGCDPVNGSDPSGTLTKARKCGLAALGVTTMESTIVGMAVGTSFTPLIGTIVGGIVGLGFGIASIFIC